MLPRRHLLSECRVVVQLRLLELTLPCITTIPPGGRPVGVLVDGLLRGSRGGRSAMFRPPSRPEGNRLVYCSHIMYIVEARRSMYPLIRENPPTICPDRRERSADVIHAVFASSVGSDPGRVRDVSASEYTAAAARRASASAWATAASTLRAAASGNYALSSIVDYSPFFSFPLDGTDQHNTS